MKMFNEDSPLYLQLRKHIEELILSGVLCDNDAMPSLRNMAKDYSLNPITVSNAIGALVDEAILYKKRGVGIYVSPGARKLIISTRSKDFITETLQPTILMAKQLDLPKQQITTIIDTIYGGKDE
ncbi:MAG: GntR family transcriptional regulator [Candidatus Cloacimonetes bacterium HGW-Cloacimonetes-3]|jgi:DNA-binding transcriptional regulator YhcF (GntR family)|nr:MAG: GntR family transcriptional regulator [Candidatus Cloacimonetes bacterium HGW-Cloacimonetes-3]